MNSMAFAPTKTSWFDDVSNNMTNNATGVQGMEYGVPEGEGPMYHTDPYLVRFQLILDVFEVYVVPVIILVGLVGNTISIIVFFRTPLRKTSSSIYLASLAICDNGFLLMLVFQWLVWFDVQIYHLSGPCQLFTYISNVCAFLSVWYVVGFTVERYIAVFYPLKRQTLCTPTRSKVVVVAFAVVAVVANNFYLWTSHIVVMYNMPVCRPNIRYIKLLTRLSNVDTMVTFIIPFVAIFFMNLRITVRITRMYRRSGLDLNNQREDCSCNAENSSPTWPLNNSSPGKATQKTCCLCRRGPGKVTNTDRYQQCDCGQQSFRKQSTKRGRQLKAKLRFSGPDRRHNHQIKITRLLLVVSTTFLVLNLPSHGFRVYGFVMTIIKGSPTSSPDVVLWQQASQLLYYCNYSINIFLYSLCGKTFRQAFWKTFGRFCCSKSMIKNNSQAQMSRRQTCDTTRLSRIQMVDQIVDVSLDNDKNRSKKYQSITTKL